MTYHPRSKDEEIGATRTLEAPVAIRQDFTAAGLVEYLGEAQPGTASSAALWRVRKFTYSANMLSKIEFADGNDDFDNIYDNKGSLSYS